MNCPTRTMPFLSCFVAYLSVPSLVDAHVRMKYVAPLSIRNAGSPTGDGRFSVAGPCGGVQSFGANGITNVVEGETYTVQIAYNGGHANANNHFSLAIACGRLQTDASLRASSGRQGLAN